MLIFLPLMPTASSQMAGLKLEGGKESPGANIEWICIAKSEPGWREKGSWLIPSRYRHEPWKDPTTLNDADEKKLKPNQESHFLQIEALLICFLT